jgi:pimeloyl-ACP methyl ester carboxylesterase
MSVLMIEQQVVHYEVLGRGRPILFLHGWVGSWRYWISVMQAASVSYRAYAIDFWGFGDSAKYQPNYSIESQVKLIDSFLYQMGIGKIALVGHGLGAVVATQYALRHPEVVDRVMAVGCPVNETSVHPRMRMAPSLELADWLLDKSPAGEPVRVEAPKTDTQAIITSISDISRSEIRDGLTRLTTSCLLVSGQNDQAVSPPDQGQIISMPYQTHAMLFEQSGHFPMLDEGSKFNRLMVDFFSLPSGESPRQLQMKEEWKRRVR